eukprot:gene14327-20313_t
MVQIRYQWWRDAVGAAFSSSGAIPVPQHPVIQALHTVLQHGVPLKKYHFSRLIDTREQDMVDSQPPLTMEGLETYAEGTASQLLYLQLGAAQVSSREADHAASHLGKAVGIITLLKGTAFHAASRRSYMPIELCAKHGVSQEDIYEGKTTDGLRDVVLAVASTAKANLEEARALQPKMPKQACGLMLPALSCQKYLQALEKSNFDPFDPSLLDLKRGAMWHVLQVKWHLINNTF